MIALNAGLLLAVLGTMVWAAVQGRKRDQRRKLAKQQSLTLQKI